MVFTRSISRSSTSKVVGSAQCASSNSMTLGCLPGSRFGDIDQGPQRLVLVLLRRHRHGAVACLTGDRQDGGDEADIGQWSAVLRDDQRFELVEFHVRCFV